MYTLNQTPHVTRLIEFAYSLSTIENIQPHLGIFNISDIVSITQYNQYFCTLSLSNNKEYYIYGTHRSLTNRYVYCLEKQYDLYHDHIIRPSVLVYHNPEAIEPDDAFLDRHQLYAFIQAIRPALLQKEYIIDKLGIL